MYFKRLELIGFKSFFDKTTLHFEPGVTAIVGPNGCGKCLRYDSLVTLASGSQVKIGELVERSLEGAQNKEILDDGIICGQDAQAVKILSLNPDTLKIEPRPVYAFIKRKAPDYLLEIKTKSGKTVTTTHYHPFFSIRGGQVVELKAEQLKEGIRIAAPRELKLSGATSEINLLEILKKFNAADLAYITSSQDLCELIASIKNKYPTYKSMAKVCDMHSLSLRSALAGQAMNVREFTQLLDGLGISVLPEFVTTLKSRSSGEIRLPRQVTAHLARFMGYIISEGRTTLSNQVWFVNEDEAVVNDFVVSARQALGVEAKVFNYEKCAKDVIIFSASLCKFMEKAFDFTINSVSRDKVVPRLMFSSPVDIIAEFLSALFEGDAYVCVSKQGKAKKDVVYFEYATASESLAKGISSLLLRLGVLSVIRVKSKYAANTKNKTKRDYYSVYIYGLSNVKKLASLLKFKGKKSHKLEEIRQLNYKGNPNLDLIPEVNDIFKDLVKLSGIKVKKIRKIAPKLAAYYENRCLPTCEGLKESLSIIAEHGKLSGLAESLYRYLKLLANSDIYWDEIVSIKKVFGEKWVYDLSVSGTHNFIAEDFIVHNSNVFDSMRWVLGEQSAKSLRGSEMQDVIFNGTDSKEPLGMAEVSLTFDNEKRFFNVDHPEVTITRRLFRSGESEYLLNKTNVRLKDILDLLLGTGIGAESYSIIAQGKIDLVLSSRPEDRRLVFDEASGITKYKAQKREATRKLEETDQNLLRVNDIVTEVKRQIGSLERQANKARRYKEVFEELKSKEVSLSQAQKKDLLKQKDELIKELSSLGAREAELLEVIRQQEEKNSKRAAELKACEEKMLEIKNEVMNLENTAVRSSEHIGFNQKRLQELEADKIYLEEQAEQTKNKLIADENKFNNVKLEFSSLQQDISDKTQLLAEKETQISALAAAIKNSLDKISGAKRDILDFVSRIANTKNEAADFNSQLQVYLARKKRLEIEKAKVYEERVSTESCLNDIIKEALALKQAVEEVSAKIAQAKGALEKENSSLTEINLASAELEKQKLALASHKEFLEELKVKYEDIGETMNAVIYLDKLPKENTSGLVVKIKGQDNLSEADKAYFNSANFKVSGEAKPIELDTQKITEKIQLLESRIRGLLNDSRNKEAVIAELKNTISGLEQELKANEIAFANKESLRQNTLEQFNKIKEEEDVIVLELGDVQRELSVLEKNLEEVRLKLADLNKGHLLAVDAIAQEESSISLSSKSREEVLVAITQAKTELEALNKRIVSDEVTLKILEGTYQQDKDNLTNIEKQLKDVFAKQELLEQEIKDCQSRIEESGLQIKEASGLLAQAEAQYQAVSDGSVGAMSKIDADRKELDAIKNKLYELQMQDKDIDYKYATVKSRMLDAYKIDLEAALDIEAGQADINMLAGEIEGLKAKLDSYGTVNLVAIEEYDELKKRYDFLIQQQADLNSAKESLHQAILKINRATKQMFLETFEKVREEFKTYFRLLFNGGDAQLFLIDEQDPLESGIEIICRPPGKKLQNVLLLSGGEKSMSAIALIFAIFKVKPSPFCVLDEIDAALDEANVDRFSRVLQEFSKTSQFIVITHNKKTIANANVMYGITMEQSGISKIVSVKFSENGAIKDKEPEVVVPA